MRNVNDMSRVNNSSSRAQALFGGGWEISRSADFLAVLEGALVSEFAAWKRPVIKIVEANDTKVSFSARFTRSLNAGDAGSDTLVIVGVAEIEHFVCFSPDGEVEYHSYMQVYWDNA